MSVHLPSEIINLTKGLIEHITGYKETTDDHTRVLRASLKHLQSSDSLYFLNRKEMDASVASLSDKFLLHGFCEEACVVQTLYESYMESRTTPGDVSTGLNVVKFLMCMSNSPTNRIMRSEVAVKGREKEEIDWPKYLLEGIPKWEPDDWESDSTSWSAMSEGSDHSVAVAGEEEKRKVHFLEEEDDLGIDAEIFREHESKRNLVLSSVQNGWFNRDFVRMMPSSSWDDAKVAILWDKYLEDQVHGLITIYRPSIVSEYKVIREIIWQLWEPHQSFCFKFSGDQLIVAPGFTIASVRMDTLRTFLEEFLPHIELLNYFRIFKKSLLGYRENAENYAKTCVTYLSYGETIRFTLEPIYEKIIEIEEKTRKQETTMTLLILASELKSLLQPVEVLTVIDAGVATSQPQPHERATRLLVYLHNGLLRCSSKLEQDLYLTLYLGSLYKYLTIIDQWLSKDVLSDPIEEFVVLDSNPKDVYRLQESLVGSSSFYKQNWQMNFTLRELPEDVQKDSLFKVISQQVLPIGKNVHILRLLGKLHLIENTSEYKTTLYEEFVENVVGELSSYFCKNEAFAGEDNCESDAEDSGYVNFKLSGMESAINEELNDIRNIVDVSDGFLMKAYEMYFVESNERSDDKTEREQTLFERISSITTSLFPAQYLVEKVLTGILQKRFALPGQTVKSLLVTDIKLDRHLEFLQYTFLFKDDLIYYFYQKLFTQLDAGGPWGNHIWLTSHLQELLMDLYPDLHENCTVHVRDSWKRCWDPLKACGMLDLNYKVSWPINVVIREEHLEIYSQLFRFILKVKWALYTLNRVFFSKSEDKKIEGPSVALMKLRILRFGLLNTFSNIQHYIFGYVVSNQQEKFVKDFELAGDIDSMVKSHDDFVRSVYAACNEFSELMEMGHGFHKLLYLVRKLRLMWRNEKEITEPEVEDMSSSYKHCVRNVNAYIALATYATI